LKKFDKSVTLEFLDPRQEKTLSLPTERNCLQFTNCLLENAKTEDFYLLDPSLFLVTHPGV
jgi:hypothetical protein